MIFSLRSQLAARSTPSMTEKQGCRHAAALLGVLLCVGAASAQTRKGPAPQAPQNVLRAVSVYEWTGDLAKPTAARVIPVSIFIDHQFQDAALYLSRPMPLALEPGNIYELESAGVNQGALTLINAGRLRNAANSFDDGWFGYGSWKPLVAPKPFVPSSTTSNAHVINSGEGRPHFSKAPADAAPASASTTPAAATPAPSKTADEPPADPDRPTLHHTAKGDPQRSDSSTASATASSAPTTGTQAANAPASTTPPATASPAPAAPTLNPPPAPATPPAAQSKPSDSQTRNEPTTGADRPTFPKQQPTDKKKKSTNASASVTDAGGLLGDDPGRPHLHHGGATTAAALPALHGLPADMQQGVAVSDAVDRPEHNFAYDWSDGNQKAVMMAKLEALARAALPPAPAPVPAHGPAPSRTHSRIRKPVVPPPVELLDEQLHAYEISYGGVDVFVFSAHTGDAATGMHYVTLLAQPDIYGALHVLLQSVTEAKHMDQTPWMRFIDAVDADGDNRAELLFELRGETQRQFALYRIGQSTATQEFVTGTMQ